MIWNETRNGGYRTICKRNSARLGDALRLQYRLITDFLDDFVEGDLFVVRQAPDNTVPFDCAGNDTVLDADLRSSDGSCSVQSSRAHTSRRGSRVRTPQ